MTFSVSRLGRSLVSCCFETAGVGWSSLMAQYSETPPTSTSPLPPSYSCSASRPASQPADSDVSPKTLLASTSSEDLAALHASVALAPPSRRASQNPSSVAPNARGKSVSAESEAEALKREEAEMVKMRMLLKLGMSSHEERMATLRQRRFEADEWSDIAERIDGIKQGRAALNHAASRQQLIQDASASVSSTRSSPITLPPGAKPAGFARAPDGRTSVTPPVSNGEKQARAPGFKAGMGRRGPELDALSFDIDAEMAEVYRERVERVAEIISQSAAAPSAQPPPKHASRGQRRGAVAFAK